MMAGMLKREPLFYGDSKIGQVMQIFRFVCQCGVLLALIAAVMLLMPRGLVCAFSIFGKPTEEQWPGFAKLPHYPDFLPNFLPKRMDVVVPLPDDYPRRAEALDLLRTSAGCAYDVGCLSISCLID